MQRASWCAAVLALLAFNACKKSGEDEPPQAPPPPPYGSQPGYGAAGQPGYGGAPGYAGASGYGGAPGYGTAPGYGGAPGYGAAGAAGQGAQPVPPLGQILADPAALQNLLAGALAGGAAALGAVTGGELAPIEAGIKSKAQSDARGMTAEGQLMSAKLQAGAHAQAPFTMQPGKCYSIVGFGGAGVFEYQLNLITAPPLPPQVLAQSLTGRADPTLGPNEQCITNPYPLPLSVNVDMHVVRGQGLVGARAYRR